MADSNRQPSTINIEVVYALPERQMLVALEVEEGTTAREAVERSGILLRYPKIELAQGRVGIFGRIAQLDTALRDGDRVEIYRPLIADPKETRRRRVKRRR